MSALPLLLVAAAAASPWSVPDVSDDPLGDLARARSAQRLGPAATASLTCPKNADSIIVCGRRGGGGGPLLPYAPVPGAPTRLVAGEASSGAAALSMRECHRLCQQPLRIDVIGTAKIMRDLAGRLFD